MSDPTAPSRSSESTDDTDPRWRPGELTRRSVLESGAALGAAGALGQLTGAAGAQSDAPEEVNLLLFSATEGWRHDNIEYANEQFQSLESDFADATGADEVTIDVIDVDGANHDFPDTASELEQYDVIVWNNTTGSVLDAQQQQAFEDYMRDGGGFAGIHAAGDTHADWDFYVEDVVGANFEAHPPGTHEAEIAVTDRTHPSTRHLPERWVVTDEWYDYDRNPRGNANVLATLNEDSYEGAQMEDGREDHPIVWCKEVDDGRAWYTGRGHTEDVWDDDDFREHVLQGVLWAGGFVEGDATATVWDSYDQVELTRDVTGPVTVQASPDGTLYVVNIDADVLAVDPDTGDTSVALDRDFYHVVEGGGHDLAFDPDFEDNRYVYFYYSPNESDLDPSEDSPYAVLSRFEVADSGEFDESSETEILRVHTQRTDNGIYNGSDYHLAGGLEFGPEGYLYLSTGDNATPHDHDGFPPMEEGTDPNWMDARGTSGDTSDLRGKLLRIEVHDDGSYSVPEDNMFTEANGYGDELDAGTVRPEIYAMGFRNPYRFGIDDETGDVYLADMGPDSREWDLDRGPLGMRTYNVIGEPANLGWPFVRYEYPYYDYDYSTNQSGDLFDPDGPTNDSPHNDGLTELPPVDTDPTVAFVATDWDEFVNEPNGGPWDTPDEVPHPELSDTGVIGGPVFNLGDVGEGGLPYSLNGRWLVAGWNAGGLHLISVDEDRELLDIEPFLTTADLESPTDLTVGPDGRLFVADWGEGLDGINPAVYRIDHEPDVTNPTADFELEGETGGWVGVSPAEIEGETNPDLPVEVGEDYRLEWTNGDGIPHNFEIRDEDDEEVLSTELVEEEGATQTVEFTMTEEMEVYVCRPHASAMRGQLQDGTVDLGNLGDPSNEVVVEMLSGAQFDPFVVHVPVGGTVRWEYASGFPHDTTAYHPDSYGTQQRIPDGAEPWESDLLEVDGDSFERTFDVEGVYDYVCTPHEEAGMVGTVVVGWPEPDDEPGLEPPGDDIPDGAANLLEDLNDAVATFLEEEDPGPCVEAGAARETLENGDVVCDVDGDGNYRDVNGSGDVTSQDLADFFQSQHREPWDSRTDLFDFNGDGNVGQPDVVDLFQHL